MRYFRTKPILHRRTTAEIKWALVLCLPLVPPPPPIWFLSLVIAVFSRWSVHFQNTVYLTNQPWGFCYHLESWRTYKKLSPLSRWFCSVSVWTAGLPHDRSINRLWLLQYLDPYWSNGNTLRGSGKPSSRDTHYSLPGGGEGDSRIKRRGGVRQTL